MNENMPCGHEEKHNDFNKLTCHYIIALRKYEMKNALPYKNTLHNVE